MPTVPGSMIENPEKHRNRRLLLVALELDLHCFWAQDYFSTVHGIRKFWPFRDNLWYACDGVLGAESIKLLWFYYLLVDNWQQQTHNSRLIKGSITTYFTNDGNLTTGNRLATTIGFRDVQKLLHVEVPNTCYTFVSGNSTTARKIKIPICPVLLQLTLKKS